MMPSGKADNWNWMALKETARRKRLQDNARHKSNSQVLGFQEIKSRIIDRWTEPDKSSVTLIVS